MTKNEIKYIIEDLIGEATNMLTPLNGVSFIQITKLEKKYPNVNSARFKFDMDNEILECYRCKPYNRETIPSEWTKGKNYDEYNGQKYYYLFEPKTLEPFVDYFDFSTIVAIGKRD